MTKGTDNSMMKESLKLLRQALVTERPVQKHQPVIPRDHIKEELVKAKQNTTWLSLLLAQHKNDQNVKL